MEPINTLKNGLKKLQDQIFTHKASLEAALKANQAISEADEEWLDHDGNLVDEEQLDEAIVKRLMAIAGPVQVMKKCKCPTMSSSTSQQKHAAAKQVDKKENATLWQWIEVLDWYYANGKWLKKESTWCTKLESSGALLHSLKQVHQTQHPEVMEMLDLWISKAMSNKLFLTGEILCQKWRAFANLAGVPEDECLTLSEGWLSQYKTWSGLKQIKCHGDAASVALDTVDKDQL
ncbi:hypothetical protein M404DRAFT_15316 [Pisolithus tinctorius Marx 270]|uniref:HTH CENPB-type domain-containing protein n=1 Tax=Pisolithus tinctorius Marx 270 TaxID=870435 RepID=A0A0C3J9D4_PISTI|nr:hypothetical protein M404DRAFT_15316 [Pisolithus tinctorius Marx 270]